MAHALARALAVLAIAALAGATRAPASTEAATAAAHAAYLASMQGRKADTLTAVQQLVADLPVGGLRATAGTGWDLTPQYAALVRFGLWDELIALTAPDVHAPGLTAGYLYGRGVALAARGRVAEARAALAALTRLGPQVSELHELIAVAVPIVAARIAATELHDADAIRELERATEAEDRLPGGRGEDWFFPVRHLLGAQLLIAGRAAQAERVYREDLRRHPGNGWALYGLGAALRLAGHKASAAATEREFARAWRQADVRLVSSAFWFAGPDTTSCECQRAAEN